ncbi:alpha-amylase family protein [Microbacterium sp. C7(2022)]|uniref:alpha-amylase n=1 Tax=Microbacterium sp. C7(2022) TaxID=2992759 RepID=UPI00237B5D7C|nr:alpha-amylase family protein [Microbacterium sp. C7(2022)]MDE0546132.1 alpha-amylase family protein [Microbacterium sp. C7(2022)]
MPRPTLLVRSALVAVAMVATLALGACAAPAQNAEVDPAAPDVGIQLFQLPWTSIANECETTLGPNGFAWVLTSPPQEHITRDEWWASYQPVSYQLQSRLGTRDEFADMVARCDAAGVDIIADAVINHMTGQDDPGIGFAGSEYAHYEYPGLYDVDDFHHCGLTTYDDIEDYTSREQVQQCELVNLADLDTASPRVREQIGSYLDDLLSLGVAGFRIDAAKHMAADDVAAIVGELPEGTRIMSEVIRGGGEPITPEEYTAFGEVFEFTYARDLTPPLSNGVFSDPELGGDRPQHVPSENALVFVDNHDTERGEANVTYRDGDMYVIANALMLADDYGTPIVYSGYAFSDRDAGASTEADGSVSDATCAEASGPREAYDDGERTCVQSWDAVIGMLRFRAAVGDAPRMPGVDEGDAYGFEREGRGVVAVNVGDEPVTIRIPTSMADGDYCDAITGGATSGDAQSCVGAQYSVESGEAVFALEPVSAAAIHVPVRQ